MRPDAASTISACSSTNDGDLLDPSRLMDLDLSPERLREVAEVFEAIRLEIERRGMPDAQDARDEHPAVFRRSAHEVAGE